MIQYQSTDTILSIAHQRGSSAKTKTGAWKYLLERMPVHKGIERLETRGRGGTSTACDHERYTQLRRDRTGDGRAKILGYDLDDPNTPGRILLAAYADNYQWECRRQYACSRNAYGKVIITSRPGGLQWPRPNTAYYDALDLISEAAAQKIIPSAYDSIEFDRRGRSDGSARHHELYDFAHDAAIVCIRRTEGSTYGVKTLSKMYLLIERMDGEIAASAISIPVAKFAKLPNIEFGAIIARVRGEAGAIKLPGAAREWDVAYKALAVDGDTLRSIYSGEEYTLSALKRERAQDDHGGGYYVYPTIEQAIACEVPDSSKCYDLPRVVVRCEVAGHEIHYGNGKIARTYIRPIEIVASVVATA